MVGHVPLFQVFSHGLKLEDQWTQYALKLVVSFGKLLPCRMTCGEISGDDMKIKSARSLRYIGSVTILLSAGLMAETFSEWSAPINLGNTTNTAAAEQ
jgi:hypothetical protein